MNEEYDIRQKEWKNSVWGFPDILNEFESVRNSYLTKSLNATLVYPVLFCRFFFFFFRGIKIHDFSESCKNALWLLVITTFVVKYVCGYK